MKGNKYMRDITEMAVFVTIIRCGSLSAAARELGLATSVVSDRLTRLERRMGTRLLVRTTRRHALTAAGQFYYQEACAIVEATARMEAHTRAIATTPAGELRITAPIPFGRWWLTPFLTRFAHRHPDIRISLTLEDRMADIVGEGFDIAIRATPALDTMLTGRRIMETRRVIVASPDYLARRGIPTGPDDLGQHDCLAHGPTPHLHTRWRLGRGAAARTERVQARMTSTDSEMPVHWALAGLGLAQKSLWEVEGHVASGRLQPVLEQWEPDPISFFAIHPVSTAHSRKIGLFIDELVQHPPPTGSGRMDAPS